MAAPSRAPASPPSGEPTTRGWTMFMKEDGEQQPPADTPRTAVPEPTVDLEGPGPSTRGWTMFTDPGSGPVSPVTPAAASGTAKGHTEMASAPLQRPTPEAAPGPDATESAAEGAEGQKKRGWTMFMDAPIADLAQKAPPAQAVPELEPPQVGASDKKGWTVFGEPSPTAGMTPSSSVPEPAPAQPSLESVAVTGSETPERGRTVMYTGTPPAPRPYAGFEEPAPTPPPSAAELAREAAAAMSPAAKNVVVAQGMSAQAGPGGGVTGRTTGAAQPDTMYFKRGQTEPEKPVSARAPTARDLEPPASLRPIEERAPRGADYHGSAMHPGAEHSPAVASGGGSKVVYIIVGVVALGAIATAAFFAFT